MNCAAFPAAAFTLTGPGATPVPGTIACSGAVATFTPRGNLAFNTVFTATISTGKPKAGGPTPLASITCGPSEQFLFPLRNSHLHRAGEWGHGRTHQPGPQRHLSARQ